MDRVLPRGISDLTSIAFDGLGVTRRMKVNFKCYIVGLMGEKNLWILKGEMKSKEV